MTQHTQTHQQASFDGETWLQRKARMERSLATWLKEPEGATRDSILANIRADISLCELYIAEEAEEQNG